MEALFMKLPIILISAEMLRHVRSLEEAVVAILVSFLGLSVLLAMVNAFTPNQKRARDDVRDQSILWLQACQKKVRSEDTLCSNCRNALLMVVIYPSITRKREQCCVVASPATNNSIISRFSCLSPFIDIAQQDKKNNRLQDT